MMLTYPSQGCSEDTSAKVSEGQAQRFPIVSSHRLLFLCYLQLLRRRLHLVETVVDKPECTDSWDDKGYAICPLGHHFAVRWTTASGIEDDKQKNEKHLVQPLAPTLHQECRRNFAATV